MTTACTPERALELAAEHDADSPTHAALLSLAKQVIDLTLASERRNKRLTDTLKQRQNWRSKAVRLEAELKAGAQSIEPFGWVVSGCHSLFKGWYAEQDARAEAKRCGGTSEAFALFTQPVRPETELLKHKEGVTT